MSSCAGQRDARLAYRLYKRDMPHRGESPKWILERLMHPPDATALGLWIVGAGALAAAVVTLWRALREVFRVARKIGHFFDDWVGEAPRPGVPGRPGFPERLGKVETAVRGLREENCEVKDQAAEIVHALYPNAGGSLRDAVNRIEARTINLPRPAPRRDGDG